MDELGSIVCVRFSEEVWPMGPFKNNTEAFQIHFNPLSQDGVCASKKLAFKKLAKQRKIQIVAKKKTQKRGLTLTHSSEQSCLTSSGGSREVQPPSGRNADGQRALFAQQMRILFV